MTMLALYIQAPFAAFRPFSAGSYRPTATFLTPSAAYGLAMNLAGECTRLDDGLSAMTVTKFGLPRARIALGADPVHPYPSVQSVYQQLHNYTVGRGNKVDDPENPGGKSYQAEIAQRRVKGNKFNITPVRREFLSDLRAIVALDFFDRDDIERVIRLAVTTPSNDPARYGLPFLGDNAFLLDKVQVLDGSPEAIWYSQVDTDAQGLVARSTRLTIWIDRQDMSKTRSAIYAPGTKPSSAIPDSAWTSIEPPTSPEFAKPAKKGKKA